MPPVMLAVALVDWSQRPATFTMPPLICIFAPAPETVIELPIALPILTVPLVIVSLPFTVIELALKVKVPPPTDNSALLVIVRLFWEMAVVFEF